MAIAFVQKKQSAEHTDSTDAVWTFDNPVTAGNLIVVLVVGYAGGPSTSLADNKGNTYSSAQEVDDTNFTGSLIEVWYTIATTGGSSFTLTCNPSSALTGFCSASEFSGIAAVSPVDKIAFIGDEVAPGELTAGETSHSTPATGTLTQADELVIAVDHYVDQSAHTLGTPAGFTDLFTQASFASSIDYASAYQIVSSTNAVTATWTHAAAQNGDFYVNAITTFKSADAGEETSVQGSLISSGYSAIRRAYDIGG